MGFFRFRRSIKLFPGVRWNFGKKSSSISIGVRGAHYTVGTRGSRTTVGIPGTGLSYTSVNSGNHRLAEEGTEEKRRSGCLTYGILGFLGMMIVAALNQGTHPDSLSGTQGTPTPRPISSPTPKLAPSPSALSPPLASTAPAPSISPNPTVVASPGNGEAAQRRAVARFPELGKANSPLNAEFLRRYHLYRQNRPSYFQNPEWPVQLAEESASALNSQER